MLVQIISVIPGMPSFFGPLTDFAFGPGTVAGDLSGSRRWAQIVFGDGFREHITPSVASTHCF
jgi:hypothetical protein